VQKIVAARDDVSCGIMLTASHNPATDNGVKVFAADGDKLPDEEELEIEAEFFKDELDDDVDLPKVDFRLITREDAIDAYSKMVDDELKLGDSLAGRKIVLDTASGAGYEFSRAVLEGFGLDVEQIDPEPDGKNINDGFGATSPEKMATKAKKRGVMGVALDGDADRIVIADEKGRLWDGDRINILLTTYLREKKQLLNNTVVVTEYSNYATVKHLEAMGVKVVNYTPGIGTPADYTTPDMKNYRTAQTLIDGLWKFEKEQGLNGALVLIHPGIVESRPDGERLYNRLGEIIRYLKKKGYRFDRLP
jgi:phosphoglucosamine mutase